MTCYINISINIEIVRQEWSNFNRGVLVLVSQTTETAGLSIVTSFNSREEEDEERILCSSGSEACAAAILAKSMAGGKRLMA